MREFAFNIVKQISVDLANESGSLATLMEGLLEVGVLVNGIMVDSGYSVSRVHFVVDKPEAALEVLARYGERVSQKDVLAITILERKKGQVTRMTRALANAHINIDTIYLTSVGEGTRSTIYISPGRVSPQKVIECLESANSV
jgi:hypothetical protein